MKKSIAVVFILAMMTVVFAPSASASKIEDPFKISQEIKVKEKPKKQTDHIRQDPKMIPPVVEYMAVEGDTLNKIGEAHGTSWQRLWQKNLGLTNPDMLNIGDKLIIPSASEVLADRPLPAAATPAPPSAPAQPTRAVVPGNGYAPGYCTWYVKSKRPDIGNFWGNADQWGYSATAAGYTVNSTPSAGAIGVAVSYMHVVFLEAVDGNRVYVSEMNYEGFGIVSSRWTDASEFTYIH